MAFDTFDKEKKGVIKTTEVQTILDMLGVEADAMAELDEAIQEADTFGKCKLFVLFNNRGNINGAFGDFCCYNNKGSGELKYEDFCSVAAKFMEEDVDVEALKSELKEAFRLYDREGNGYITTDVFREILCEIDENLTEDQLDMIIEEIDADGSGTLDFEGSMRFHVVLVFHIHSYSLKLHFFFFSEFVEAMTH